jgi:hypothetical protein
MPLRVILTTHSRRMGWTNTIKRNLTLIPGWRSRRKLVVIESDDWGTIRMPDIETFNTLTRLLPHILGDTISCFDALETEDDISALFGVLGNVHDFKGNPAIMTLNTITSNPDFQKIKENKFQKYFSELITDSYKKDAFRKNIPDLISQGIDHRLVKPQFHGREHVNYYRWLELLRSGNKDLMEAFKFGIFGIPISEPEGKRKNLMASFDYESIEEKGNHSEVIRQGLSQFESIYEFRSKSFIAPSYIWDDNVEKILSQEGVKYIQGIPFQHVPAPGARWYKRRFHYTGQQNNNQQCYLVRNVIFEPGLIGNNVKISEIINRIQQAFFWGKPAIISTHRVNFIGSISEKNRKENLQLFSYLLTKIVDRWHDVEFISSDELGDIITGNK